MSNELTQDQREVLEICHRVIGEIKKVIIGKDEVIIKVLLSILAGGHVLIEDIPGVGKTTLALALSRSLSLDYNRVQFTPDVLPTDITGYMSLNRATNKFEYKKGAAMTNLLLADEINRTSSKTQSALLEVMEEGRVTVDGVTYKTPDPFIVIATQNPIGSIGTQMLPESQMDRFIVCLTMGYPSLQNEIDMLKSKHSGLNVNSIKPAATAEQLSHAISVTDQIYVADPIFEYIARLADTTRKHPFVRLGLSPRGAISLLKMTKATALLNGRSFAIPDDVLYTFYDVCTHRIILNSKAKINNMTVSALLKEIISATPVPSIKA
ncbi:MAG: MoxR family ATPase [Ruminococcus sp.]|nr:MoxR family ATPase [Ruminococcus sp.]